MFQIPSLIQSNGRESNATDTEKIHNNYYLYQKNPYRVLFVMPKWSVLCFYLRSISVGMFVLFKWTFQMLWNVVSPASISSRFNTNSIEYYGCLHDKPPPCLVNNRIGLQSYVKLKVSDVIDRQMKNPFQSILICIVFRVWNCITSRQDVMEIRSFCCCMDFLTVGSDGIIRYVLQRLNAFPFAIRRDMRFCFQIKELSRFFRVVALDLKGFNDSDKPQWRKDYTPQIICGELLQFIKSMGVNNVTIIGHDIGALIGYETFIHHKHSTQIDWNLFCV